MADVENMHLAALHSEEHAEVAIEELPDFYVEHLVLGCQRTALGEAAQGFNRRERALQPGRGS